MVLLSNDGTQFIGDGGTGQTGDGGAGGTSGGGSGSTPYWKNGVTRLTVPGYPPDGWTLNNDGWYYPPTVVTNPTGSVSGSSSGSGSVSGSGVGPPLYTPLPTSLQIFVRIEVGAPPQPQDVPLKTVISVYPAVINYAPVTQSIGSALTIKPIAIALKDKAMSAVRKLLSGSIENFFDRDRELKTLVNFGNDYQALLTSWEYDETDLEKQTMLVKLYEPLPDDVEQKTPVWVVRELAQPLIDRLFVKNTPPPPPKVYLRPANRNVSLAGRNGATVENATMANLLSTGSAYAIRQTDPVLEEWFTDDVNSVELNIDYSDYTQFIFFGSAQSRLDAFVQKLTILENYDSILALNSASRAGTGSGAITGSVTYPALQALSEKRVDLIRTFDPYERFLYYASGSAYSSSFGADADDAFYFATDATWPKINGVIAPIASASVWYVSQSAIATAFDQGNINSLANNVPGYLKDDVNSTEYIQFLNMIGHQFDVLKTYIDHMTKIYDRSSDSTVGISPDLIWNVAEAFGIELPNQYSVKNLVDYTIGQVGTVNTQDYRNAAAETWKRFLHNQIFLMKTKGTKTALRGLVNTYGILPTTIQIRESQTPGFDYPSASFEVIEQQTNVLNLSTGSAFIGMPWSASGAPAVYSLETRFSTTNNTTSTILMNADNMWAVRLSPLTGSWGNITLFSGSTPTLSSSYMQLYSGDFYSLLIRHNGSSTDLIVKRAEQENLVESFTGNAIGLSNIWFKPSRLYIGSSGSFFGAGFTGYVDEFRAWGEVLNSDIFDLHVKYPGMYNGNLSTSARDLLYVRLSFGKPKNLGTGSLADQYILNESPYIRTPSASAILLNLSASGFPNVTTFPNSMITVVREITRHTPNAGANLFSTNKVTVAPSATFIFSSGSTVPVLSPKNSIVSLRQKVDQPQNTNTVGFYFSITDAVNDNIIRTLGNIDLQDLIGDPGYLYSSSYTELEKLNALYWNTYAYSFNANSFVDFVKNLLTPLFQQAKKLVPARAKLLSGIVHEPHILERHKQIIVQPIEKTSEYFETVAAPAYPTRSLGAVRHYDAVFVVSQSMEPSAAKESYTARLVTTSSIKPYAVREQVSGSIRFTSSFHATAVRENYSSSIKNITGSTPRLSFRSYDDITNFQAYKLNLLNGYGVTDPMALTISQQATYYNLLSTFRSPNTVRIVASVMDSAKTYMTSASISASSVIRAIEPYSDFTKIDATTFFMNPVGIVGVPTYQKVRVNQNVITSKGLWITGSTYNRDDYVSISGSNGTITEYVCVTFFNPFVSMIDPSQDSQNWRRMVYVNTLVYSPQKAVLISGSVSLVSTGSALVPMVGYQPQHYRFTRDKRRGTLNHQFLGCLQTQNTTIDGKPPVEILPTAGDTLVVNNPGEPIKPNDNQSGPILDVR